MKRALLLLWLPVVAIYGQGRGHLADYALILEDAPVAQKVVGRAALRSSAAQAQLARIRDGQSAVMQELAARKVPVSGATQVLVNAVFVRATHDTAVALRGIPGVAHVVYAPPLKPDFDPALDLENVPAAWAAVGGEGAAGAGIKIGIIDTGIDQTHPGFQDATLRPPAGYPKGDTGYTNNKVIVARSYVAMDSIAYDPNNPVASSTPDDLSPRDRFGHGTAIAMIAAGVQNTGPLGTIEGVAPKGFLGNYKVIGSPGVNPFASYAGVAQALEDALADGMDIVTLSLSEGDPALFGPLDVDSSANGCGGACDIYATAVENAVKQGLVVVVSAGNDGNIGTRVPTLTTIHTPGTAPSAITVGAAMNSRILYQTLKVNLKSAVRTYNALFSDGPHLATPKTAPIRDITLTGNDGFACSSLAAGSLNGAIALIQRGTCDFSVKINNAQNAGAVGVVIYNSNGDNTVFSQLFAQNTGIPAVMIGNADGVELKNSLASNTSATATLDPALSAVDSSSQAKTIWPASSRGPSPGTFGATPTTVIKPELVAIGANVYTAAQKVDPNGDVYHASGYTGVTGTSYAVPMVAGAVALVKQKNPKLTPAQLKSAVVNTASQSVTDENGAASVNSMGAGLLNAGDAVNAAATLEPATIEFGSLVVGSLPINRNVVVTNLTNASVTFTIGLKPTNSSIQVPANITVAPGQQNNFTVSLKGPVSATSEGFIELSGSGPTLRIPYQYLVSDAVPADVFPVRNGSFVGLTSDTGWPIAVRLIDRYGVPLVNLPARYDVVQGGGKIAVGDAQTFRLGIAGALVNLGPNPGDQIFKVTFPSAPSLSYQFNGFARAYPTIDPNRVLNAGSFDVNKGLAPGSYIAVFGSSLSDATQVESTFSLPVSLSNVSVSFDGAGMSIPGHIHFVSPGQVNVQIPWEFQGQTSVWMKVTLGGSLFSQPFLVPLNQYSPGVFAIVDASSNAVVTQGVPIKRGDTLVIYANGLGPVDNQPASGEPSPQVPANTKVKATVTIGSVPATWQFSGLTPGSVGLYQVNVVVPDSTPVGNQPLVVSIGGVDAKPVTVQIQ